MKGYEVNFDGIIGPTHNYAGLSWGNVASMKHSQAISNPRQAALEGLAKMKFLHDLGVKQAVLPPHHRPDIAWLRARGIEGTTDAQLLENTYQADPKLLAAAYSASAMWAANAATVSPSADCSDGRVHFTPANLISNVHRSLEAKTTTRILRAIFADESQFAVHDPLPATLVMSDEGAANHMRLCDNHGSEGAEIFVYGSPGPRQPTQFPARQVLGASQLVAKQHRLNPARTIFIQQNPDAIDAGAFHNDVVAVANQNVLFFHESAYAGYIKQDTILRDADFHAIQAPAARVSLAEAVSTYLFNSQLVTLPDGTMSLIAPIECRENARVHDFIQDVLARGTPVKTAHFVDVRQSMHNGGGPACLRLRVVLTEKQLHSISGNVLFTDTLHNQLKTWIEKHYREKLQPDDLRDPQLMEESRRALDELSQVLRIQW